MVKIIDYRKIRDLNIDPIEFYEWIDKSLGLKHRSSLPAKTSISLPGNGFFNVMPCVMPSIGSFGVKMVNRYPGREPAMDSQILLYDNETGKLEAILDGNYITAMRTGAVTAHSIKLLAKQDFKTIGFIGLGNTAYATMDILLRIFEGRDLEIGLYKYKGQEKAFMERYSGRGNVRFTLHDDHRTLIHRSDVVISCVTYTEGDFCGEDAFREGCTVIPVHTRGFMCCDASFDKVFADDVKHVSGFKNFDKFKSLCEVGKVVAGECPGRENDSERILVYNIGIGLHDVFFARMVFDMIRSSETADLKPPNEKYWV
jgi:ornithine cyclodeaminase/alanine dehydrogenase